MSSRSQSAKAKHREVEARTRMSAEAKNVFNKRPLQVTPATSTSPTAPHTRSYPTMPSQLRNATTSVTALQELTQGDGASSNSKGKGRIGRDGFPVEDDPNKVGNSVMNPGITLLTVCIASPEPIRQIPRIRFIYAQELQRRVPYGQRS